MEFKSRELTFSLTDKGRFNEREVKDALAAVGFPDVEVRAGPS
jgi:hypothetical protein